jgi:hypothetical protein
LKNGYRHLKKGIQIPNILNPGLIKKRDQEYFIGTILLVNILEQRPNPSSGFIFLL